MQKTGTLFFELQDVGSKSEALRPVLREENGEICRLFLEGDNPFMNEGLKPYDGKTVTLDGEFDETDTFVVSHVATPAEAEAPAPESAPKAESPAIEAEASPVEAEAPQSVSLDAVPEVKPARRRFSFFRRLFRRGK